MLISATTRKQTKQSRSCGFKSTLKAVQDGAALRSLAKQLPTDLVYNIGSSFIWHDTLAVRGFHIELRSSLYYNIQFPPSQNVLPEINLICQVVFYFADFYVFQEPSGGRKQQTSNKSSLIIHPVSGCSR